MTSDRDIPEAASVSGQDGLPPLPAWLRYRVEVTLDGRPVSSCVAYSVPAGFVRTVVKDGAGRLVMDANEIATVRVEGVVRVRLTGQTAIDRPSHPSYGTNLRKG